MKFQVKPQGAAQELTVQSQKEFLQLYNRGVIAADDLVLRGERWVRARDLPWIHGMHQETKRDNKQLFWITLAMMVLGLAGVIWIQSHSATVAKKTGIAPPDETFRRGPLQQGERPLPPGAVRAVPAR
jgi:hypothetical protein